MIGRLFAAALLLCLMGCLSLEPRTRLPSMATSADVIHVVARVGCSGERPYSGDLCHVIDDPEQIAAIEAFVNARPDDWYTPISGAPIHPVRVEFRRDGELVEAVGLSKESVERRMFLSRTLSADEVDELLRLVGLDRSHLRFRVDAPIPE